MKRWLDRLADWWLGGRPETSAGTRAAERDDVQAFILDLIDELRGLGSWEEAKISDRLEELAYRLGRGFHQGRFDASKHGLRILQLYRHPGL